VKAMKIKGYLLWILASILLFIGMSIINLWEYEPIGSTTWSNALTFIISFIFVLLSSLCMLAATYEFVEEEEK